MLLDNNSVHVYKIYNIIGSIRLTKAGAIPLLLYLNSSAALHFEIISFEKETLLLIHRQILDLEHNNFYVKHIFIMSTSNSASTMRRDEILKSIAGSDQKLKTDE